MTDSQQLLATFARTGSDAAFRELVTRYVDLVYSTALRLVNGDSHRAQDVAQVVFVDLSRTASTLGGEVRLGGWLHRHTCYVAANTMRGERRRLSRERQAVEMNALQEPSDTNLSRFAPVLDEVINELGEADRTAILLRFFEQHDFRSVGKALGSNEDAARMRVTRALEKLEALLKRRGLTTTGATLALVLCAGAVQAAPAGLGTTISVAALTGSTLAAGTTATLTKAITVTTLQKTFVAVVIAAAVGTGIYEATKASQLRDELHALQRQHAPLAEQNDQLRRECEEAAAKLAALTDEIERIKPASSELLKLRGEVGRLRQSAQELDEMKKGGGDDATIAAAVSWKERVTRLKQHLEQNPGASIPEMQLATEQDWLDVTRQELRTDLDYRVAMSRLRGAVEARMVPQLSDALKAYMKENQRQFPTDISQLQPYFTAPVAPAILQRYAVLPKGDIPSLGFGGEWIISQKAPVDAQYDIRIGIGPNGTGSTGPQSWKGGPDVKGIEETLTPIFKAYMAANGGKEPLSEELLPYIKTPEQRAAYDKALELKAANR